MKYFIHRTLITAVITALFSALVVQTAMCGDYQINARAHELAIKSMESQIIELKEGFFYKAGDNQFNTLWTRDFAYSIESLLFHDKDMVVRDHLDFLLNNMDQDGLVPLYADSTQPMFRVALASLRVILPIVPGLKLKSPLKVYYKVSGRYPVIDSNALVVIGACLYLKKTQDFDFLSRHKTQLLKALNFYKKKMSPRGLIVQDPFSDWQDSARRKGEIFLTQLHYWRAASLLEEALYEELIDNEAFKEKIKEHFFNKHLGLFVIDPNDKTIRRALEDQLFAIRYKIVTDEDAIKLYENLKQDPLWTTSGPGRASFPAYDKSEINWYVKLSGVSDYHGPLHWSWLWGLTGIVALEMNDAVTVKNLSRKIENVLKRDLAVGEVYSPLKEFPLYRNSFYKSEKPFGWGSAYISYFFGLADSRAVPEFLL